MTREEVLERAKECVTEKRHEDYGTPEDNFALIARLWTDYCGFGFSAEDVAMMMALLKIARIRAGGTDDCFVDLAGYAACGGEIASNQKPTGDEWVDEVVNSMKEPAEKKSVKKWKPEKLLTEDEIDQLSQTLHPDEVSRLRKLEEEGNDKEIMSPEDIARLIAGV